jgi:hypothetical protein
MRTPITIPRALVAMTVLVVVESGATGCGLPNGGVAPTAIDAGGQDGTASCGGLGERCCNGTACNAGLTCNSSTCIAPLIEAGATADAASHGAADDEGGNPGSGLEAGDDASPETGPDSGADSTVADAADDTGSNDAGTGPGSTEGGPIDAGSPDASGAGAPDASQLGGDGGLSACLVPEGGASCTPGTVSCGNSSCSTATDYCCAASDGGGTCNPNDAGTCASGVRVACNEAADCPSGSVCCQLDAYGPHSATCETSCPTGYFQVCRTDSECATSASTDTHTCIVQLCPPSEGAAATVTLEACSYYTAGVGYGPLPACTAL